MLIFFSGQLGSAYRRSCIHLNGERLSENFTCAAGYQTRDIIPPTRHVQPAVSRMGVPTPWLVEMAETLEEVMNAESLELQAIFNSDHLVSHCCMLKRCLGVLSCSSHIFWQGIIVQPVVKGHSGVRSQESEVLCSLQLWLKKVSSQI